MELLLFSYSVLFSWTITWTEFGGEIWGKTSKRWNNQVRDIHGSYNYTHIGHVYMYMYHISLYKRLGVYFLTRVQCSNNDDLRLLFRLLTRQQRVSNWHRSFLLISLAVIACCHSAPGSIGLDMWTFAKFCHILGIYLG